MATEDDDGFRQFVDLRYADLLRVAYLLTGSAHDAEDLVQSALLKVMRRWKRVDEPFAYLRRTMINQHLSVWRRVRWLVAPRGADPARLADPAATSGGGDGLEPFELTWELGSTENTDGVTVGVVPAGCVIESAPLPDITDWRVEPTRSYVVRTPATERPEWFRVVCAGEVKDVRPAPARMPGQHLPKSVVDAAIEGARGKVDEALARSTVDIEAQSNGYETVAAPTALWGGVVAGTTPDQNGGFDGTAVLTAAPLVGGGWLVRLSHDIDPMATSAVAGAIAYPETDPTDTSELLPIRLGDGPSVLVIAPEGAATLRAVRFGTVLDAAPVQDAAAVLEAPATPGLMFEALDADGRMLDSGRLTDPNQVASAGRFDW